MKLKTLKKTPLQIAQLIASNPIIINLIYNDSSSALTDENIVVDFNSLVTDGYINFYPATDAGIRDIQRNTFIVINLEDFNLNATDSNTTATGAIYITTDKAHSLLDNNKLRLLELADEIETTLADQKLASAGQIKMMSMTYVVFSEFRSGYRISFRLADQQTRKAEL